MAGGSELPATLLASKACPLLRAIVCVRERRALSLSIPTNRLCWPLLLPKLLRHQSWLRPVDPRQTKFPTNVPPDPQPQICFPSSGALRRREWIACGPANPFVLHSNPQPSSLAAFWTRESCSDKCWWRSALTILRVRRVLRSFRVV